MSFQITPAFDAFIAEHIGYLRTHSRRLSASAHDADDLVQDTVERALRHFSAEKSLYGQRWLSRIMTNLFLDSCRRSQRYRAELGVDLDSLAAADEVEVEPAWLSVSMAQIDEAVDRLSVPFRCVVIRRWRLEQSQREIAGALGVPLQTVGTRLHRARARVRQALQEGLQAVEAEPA